MKKRNLGRPKSEALIKNADQLRYQVILETRPAEWAKQQPGGLSATLRRLLREEYERIHKKS